MERRTERLILRGWRDADREPFAALNADPLAMEHFPSTMTRAESDAFAGRADAALRQRGWGLWAVEVAGGAPFIGAVGLNEVRFDAPFTPAVEVLWRLLPAYWGHGYATEAAREALAVGFGELGLAEIVSFTIPANHRSRAVMGRLGMRRDPTGDFDHPNLPDGHPMRRHVLYRLQRTGSSVQAPPPRPSP